MRELPILFNTEMVKAILRAFPEKKTTTRRVVKGYIPEDAIWGYTPFTPERHISCRGTFSDGYGEKFFRMPCQKGDILYVRETWGEWTDGYVYKAWTSPFPQPGCYPTTTWHPSIHMPKEAARIWLKVTDVRVEHLQEMKLDDFLSEGISIRPENAYMQARNGFINIWDSTIKKTEQELYSWDADPWVWVIGFKKCERPEKERI